MREVKLRGRCYTLLEVSLTRLLFSFSSLNSCNLKLEGIIYLVHALNSLSERDKKHDHQQQILQSIVFLSIVRREPSGVIADGRR